jgi:hypothetical protein
MLLGRANQELDCAAAAAAAGPDAKRVLAAWSPPISRLLSAMRSVPKDDDRRMPVMVEAGVKGGFLLPVCGAVGGFRLAAPKDCAFSNAIVPRAARLNDCEFRDNVPRALVSESSREIVPPTGAMVASLASCSGAVDCNSMSMSVLSETSVAVAGTAGSRAAHGSPLVLFLATFFKLARQRGQVECASNHASIHSWWKICLQTGSKRKLSSGSNSVKQTGHSRSSFSSKSVMCTMGSASTASLSKPRDFGFQPPLPEVGVLVFRFPVKHFRTKIDTNPSTKQPPIKTMMITAMVGLNFALFIPLL